ncbi:hypothetical protein PR048_004804 [Dryococelus australis]|uniref:Uncharacterized protein n=1 Tax=Dryococelus australis TaxID=614101 RepID=A0ABQ9I7J1_9NEOP|nr:hypothetical protein PR048_004804 [Dryococelus australis]
MTDISSMFQLVVVFRCVLPNGQAVERFWQFVNPSGHDAASIALCICIVLDSVVDEHEKAISQSYDGASVRAIIQQQYIYTHTRTLCALLCTPFEFCRSTIYKSKSTSPFIFFPACSPQRIAVFGNMLLVGEFLTLPLQGEILRVKLLTHQNNNQPSWSYSAHVGWSSICILTRSFSHHHDSCGLEKERGNLEEVKIQAEMLVPEQHFNNNNNNKKKFHVNRTVVAKVYDVIANQVKERFSFTTYMLYVFLMPNIFRNTVHLLEHTTKTYPFLDKVCLKTELGVIYK